MQTTWYRHEVNEHFHEDQSRKKVENHSEFKGSNNNLHYLSNIMHCISSSHLRYWPDTSPCILKIGRRLSQRCPCHIWPTHAADCVLSDSQLPRPARSRSITSALLTHGLLLPPRARRCRRPRSPRRSWYCSTRNNWQFYPIVCFKIFVADWIDIAVSISHLQ